MLRSLVKKKLRFSNYFGAKYFTTKAPNLANATDFFNDLELGKGPSGISKYIVEGATFQCDALPQFKTLSDYSAFMKDIYTILPDFKYTIDSVTSNQTEVSFFATMTATHTGKNGPVEPSNPPKSTKCNYVYLVSYNGQGKITGMRKCFDIFTGFSKLNWPLH